jgi:hypothetical protein
MKKESVDWNGVASYTGAGLMAGGGISALVHALKDYNRQRVETAPATQAYDDGTLYLNIQDPRSDAMKTREREERQKRASWWEDSKKWVSDKNDKLDADRVRDFMGSNSETTAPTVDDPGTFDYFLRGAGALGAGYLGYKGVTGLYDKVREQALAEEMDSAQRAYIGALHDKKDEERTKYANYGALAGAGALSVGALLAMASAYGTNVMLDKFNPKPVTGKLGVGGRAVKRRMPKKIVVDRKGDENDEVLYERPTEHDTAADEIENMLRAATADRGLAKKSSVNDILNGIAGGRIEEIKSATSTVGVNHACNIVSGIGEAPTIAKELAIGILSRDPMLKEAFAPLIAAEIYDMSPSLCALARTFTPGQGAALQKIASLLTAEYRKNIFAEEQPFIEKRAILGPVWEGLKYVSLYELMAQARKKEADTEFGDYEDVGDGKRDAKDESSSFHFKGEDSQGTTDEGETVEEDEQDSDKDEEQDDVDRIFDDSTLQSLKEK